MKNTMILSLGALLTFGAVPVVSAQDAGAPAKSRSADNRQERRGGEGTQRRARMRARHDMSAVRGIELTEAQREQIRAINVRYRDEMKTMRGDARPQGAERQRPDSAQRAQIRQFNERRRAEIRAALTPAQQQQFDRNVADSKDKMQKRMKEHGKRGKSGKQGA